jgi:AP-3 complex subunit mu
MEIQMPKTVLNCILTPTQGRYTFDPVTKLLVWEVGRIDPAKVPNIRGTVSVQAGSPAPESNPPISLKFNIPQLAISGIKVSRLDMFGEKYKPFKGVKYITKAGRFQVRT